MATVTIEDAGATWTELARLVEAGETVTVTRDGHPILDLVPHRSRALDHEGARRFLEERGITDPVPYIADDFDDPLLDDVLLRPFPQ